MLKLSIRHAVSTVVFFAALQTQAATVILGADSNTINTKARSIETEYAQGMRDERLMNTYSSTLSMRQQLKVGAGMSVGGALGTMGFNLELNVEDADGAIAGFGTGHGYNSFQLAWKHAFEGDYLAPYFTAGYSRWYNSSGSTSAANHSGILDRVLTTEEKKTGRFGTDFVNASFGLQYNQLSGDFRGVSVYAELMAMTEIKRGMLVPTGTVGALYYF
ncbi:hypothetical protein [Bdellovibrio bacteriovorus]|uniref:DUF481 domain-containing protein n=1 Tax=Bdellovibrio bacteriovorus TaxID=959 RepID=A0A1Z3N3X6_BDEBC|nr:hypothetical protein [Bdellovibrio bacteriovorus]ASD62176.1 hypothetical protein B9G79_00650 [Bdellovibrio bacteriovorus]